MRSGRDRLIDVLTDAGAPAVPAAAIARVSAPPEPLGGEPGAATSAEHLGDWAKFEALVAGARLASERLWRS